MAAAAASRNHQEEQNSLYGIREKNEGVPTVIVHPFLISYKGILWHGTTCVSSISEVGLLFLGDGLGRCNNPEKPKDDRIVTEIDRKVLFVGNRMLISMAGDGFWHRYILKQLKPLIEDPALVDEWTCKRCARFVYDTILEGPEPLLELYKLKPGALDGALCSMLFGAYEQNQAKLFYGGNDSWHEIFDASVYDPTKDPEGEQEMYLKSIGAGAEIMDQETFDNNAINILSGDRHFEEQLILLLSAMKETCDTQEDTGGVILAYYMPPPPGVAHIVYDDFYECIPLDVLMIKADMYRRLHEAAVEAGSFVAADYKEQFFQASIDYERMLLQLSASTERSIKKKDELLEKLDKEDKQLADLQRLLRKRLRILQGRLRRREQRLNPAS